MAVLDTISISDARLTTEKFPLKDRSLHLSVEVREKELFTCILDKRLNKYVAWASYPYSLNDISLNTALKDDLFLSDFASISVVFTANNALLMPAQFFKKEHIQDYLKLQQLDKQGETPCYDYIKNLDSYNVYTINTALLTKIKEVFPNAHFLHHSSIFTEFVLIENKNTHEDRVYVSVFNRYIDVNVLHSGKLLLSNRFNYENSSDFMYYLLWVYEQLNLDAEKVPCVFYGDIDSEKYTLSGKYIKKVSTGSRNEQSGYAAALEKLPAHKYRSLFTQYLCV